MAKIKIDASTTGTGTFTISAPNSNTDRTLTLPDTTSSLLTTSYTGDVNFSSGTLFVDQSTSRVGIGTTSPSTNLHISDTSNTIIKVSDTTGTITSIFGNFGSRGYVGMQTAHPLSFYTNDTERMRIDSSGHLLIGTTSTTNLADNDVVRIVGNTNGVDLGGSASTGNLRLRGSDTGAGLVDFTKLSLDPSTSPYYNGRIFYSFNDNFMRFETNGSEKMRITSGGNVGIGTTSPTSRLHVVDTDYTDIQITAGSTGHGAAVLFGDSTDNDYGSIMQFATSAGEGGRMRFIAGGTETMNLRGGNVGIGTNSPSQTLHLYSSSSNTNFMIETPTAGSDARAYIKRNGNTSRAFLNFSDSSTSATWYTGLLRGTSSNYSIGQADDYNSTTTALIIDASRNLVSNGEYAKLGTYNVVSGSTYYGDFDINVAGLSTLSGSAWKSYGLLIAYCGVAGDQSDQKNNVFYIRLRGLSSWNQYSIENIAGTNAVTLVSAAASSVTVRVTSPGAYQEGGFTVISTANSGHYITTDA